MGRNIYGNAVRMKKYTKSCCDLGNNFSDRVFLEASMEMLNVLTELTGVIDAMIKLRVEMLFIGQMTATSNATVSPPMMTRFMWLEENKGTKFDRDNPIHVLQLKDKYMQINEDWQQDPLLKKVEADVSASAAAALSEINLTAIK
jgi:hypothetical protein